LFLSRAKPIQSTPHHTISPRPILILSTHLRLCLPSGLFPSGYPTTNLYALLLSSISATCPAHFILRIILIILGEEYKTRSSLFYSFHHPPFTSSPFGPIILFRSSQTPSVYVPPFVPIQNHGQNYSRVYYNFCIVR
jgi:hypothetical protein